jgi:hypothetical protein
MIEINKLIRLDLQPDLNFEVYYTFNNQHIGSIEKSIDGYYYYWPTGIGGYWTAIVMREIADALDQLNEEWDKIVSGACLDESSL